MNALDLIAFNESERMYLAALRFHERQALIDDRKHRPIISRKHTAAAAWIQRANRPIVVKVPHDQQDHDDREGAWPE